jgi:HlyD family secretion protein
LQATKLSWNSQTRSCDARQRWSIRGGQPTKFSTSAISNPNTTVFLPAQQAGRLKVGSDPDASRIVVDAYPEYVFPASVSFVAPESQFTPKTVEVQSEREQLVFRVKLQKPPGVLRGMEEQIKSGLRAVAYVRLDPAVEWPPELAVKLPPTEQVVR